MNKAELVAAVQASGNYSSRASAEQAVADVLGAISGGIANDGKVQIVGFGTFAVKERAARQGRNPRTGEPVQIAASKNVSFKAGKALKESL